MRDFDGKTAFVTGGASGIGLAMGRAFLDLGMKVMLADVDTGALENALQSLSSYDNRVRGVPCDVADLESVERAAQDTFDAFGNVHVACNNAGVAAGGGIDNISVDNWRWVVDVNLMGVVYGVRSFLPHMMKHREGGHIVNTASMAGMINGMGFSPYVATKFAVVAMSEGLAMQVKPHGIGVSVLCPEYVRTRFGEIGRNRPERYGRLDPASPAAQVVAENARRLEAGIDPAEVAARVVDAIRTRQFYIFTHPNMREGVDQRFAAIQAAMDRVKS
jgi:NAD(P)-dependent dehydrogenase (short-subunit alcohol dehydrogenase family)